MSNTSEESHTIGLLPIQIWGSEIWTSQDFEWPKIGWVAIGPNF